MKKDQLSARCLEIGFEGGLGEEVTAHAGVALLVEVGRLSGVIAAADRALPAKKNPKGLTQGQMVAGPGSRWSYCPFLVGSVQTIFRPCAKTRVWRRWWASNCQPLRRFGPGWISVTMRRRWPGGLRRAVSSRRSRHVWLG